MTILKTSPTVLNVNYEEITLNYISSLLISDKENKNNVDMNLVQEELFVYSWTEMTRDSKVRQNLANTQINANTIIYLRHYDFYLRGNCAIIGAGKMCSTGVGEEVFNEPPENKRIKFFRKRLLYGKNIWI